MNRAFSSVVFAILASGLAACADAPPPKPKAPATPPAAAIPDCPQTIAPGGDAEAADGLDGKAIVRRCLVGGSEATRKASERIQLLGEGDVLHAPRLRKDLGALMGSGAFDDVAAYGIPTSDGKGVVIVYSLKDRAVIADVVFEGAKVLGNDTLIAKIPIPKGATLDPQKLSGIAHAVRDEYLLRGYAECRVVVVREVAVPASPSAPEQVHVRFKVDEGSQEHLGKVDLKGVKRISESEIRKAANLIAGQPYVHEDLDRARDSVAVLYYDRGFVGVHLEVQESKPDDKGVVPVSILVEEGDSFTIRSLHVTGAGTPFEKELLDKVVKSKPHQVMNRSLMLGDIEKIREFFKAKNREVNVNPLSDIDQKAHTIDVTFEVAE